MSMHQQIKQLLEPYIQPYQEAFNSFDELQKRLISGTLMAVMSFFFLYIGGVLFALSVALLSSLAYKEWLTLWMGKPHKYVEWVGYATFFLLSMVSWIGSIQISAVVLFLGTVAAYMIFTTVVTKRSQDAPLVTIAGLPYIGLTAMLFVWLRHDIWLSLGSPDFAAILILILMVVATDTGAYFTGKNFGKKPLAPKISPKKTVEGLIGGVASSVFLGVATALVLQTGHVFLFLVLAILVAISAQMGDLAISWVKRTVGKKDSGHLIPGHGGVLDRLDGFLTATPLYSIVVYYFMTA